MRVPQSRAKLRPGNSRSPRDTGPIRLTYLFGFGLMLTCLEVKPIKPRAGTG